MVDTRGYTQMFYGCINLREVDISKFDTSNNPTMSGMFRDCEKLTKFSSLPAKAFTPLKMDNMFDACVKLKGHESYQEGTTTYKNDVSKAHTGWYFTKK